MCHPRLKRSCRTLAPQPSQPPKSAAIPTLETTSRYPRAYGSRWLYRAVSSGLCPGSWRLWFSPASLKFQSSFSPCPPFLRFRLHLGEGVETSLLSQSLSAVVTPFSWDEGKQHVSSGGFALSAVVTPFSWDGVSSTSALRGRERRKSFSVSLSSVVGLKGGGELPSSGRVFLFRERLAARRTGRGI